MKKIAVLIAALASLAFVIISLPNVLRSSAIKKNGKSAEATVMEVGKRLSQKSELRDVTVSFITEDGRPVLATGAKHSYAAQGDRVKVWYMPDSPQKIDFGDTTGYNMRAVLIGGFMFLFLMYFFVKMVVGDAAAKRLVKSGLKVSAGSVRIDRNEKYRMGDNNPWVMRCSWRDEKGREFMFSSKDYTIDPSPYLTGKEYIDVYIDPADPANYFMDTSFMPEGNNTIG